MERDSVSLPDDSNKKCTGSAHCFSLAGCGRGLSVRVTAFSECKVNLHQSTRLRTSSRDRLMTSLMHIHARQLEWKRGKVTRRPTTVHAF